MTSGLVMKRDLFHVALIVPQLEPAIDELSSLLNVEWESFFHGSLALHEPGVGYREIPMHIANSTGRPFLEVIQAVPDSPWALSESGSNLHHMGFFTEDLDASSSEVSYSFCPFEICGVGHGGEMPSTFTYHSRGGFRIELVARQRITSALR